MLNSNFSLKDKGVSNALSTPNLPRHRWYFVKEGFSPELVEKAMVTANVEKNELLLDTFSGSGTAPLTAAGSGLKTIGFELNPFLHFLSATKLSQAEPDKFFNSADAIIEGFKTPIPSPLEGFSTFTCPNRWGRWLFNRNVLRVYNAGFQALNLVTESHRNLLKLALLGAIMDCCNAERDGKCLRYKKHWRENPYSQADFISAFNERVKIVKDDLANTPLSNVDAKILQGDSRNLVENKFSEKFKLCITSPPYLNSFDYSDVYRPELFLGGFVSSNDLLMNIRLKTVRSHVQAKWESPKKDDFGILYKNCISKLRKVENELWDKRIPLMVQAYFEDMHTILSNLKKNALPNASAWFVVSTSAYAGIEIPVDLILADIGQQCGWFLNEVGVLRYLRSSGQQMNGLAKDDRGAIPLRESVVIFNASKKSNYAGVFKCSPN